MSIYEALLELFDEMKNSKKNIFARKMKFKNFLTYRRKFSHALTRMMKNLKVTTFNRSVGRSFKWLKNFWDMCEQN